MNPIKIRQKTGTRTHFRLHCHWFIFKPVFVVEPTTATAPKISAIRFHRRLSSGDIYVSWHNQHELSSPLPTFHREFGMLFAWKHPLTTAGGHSQGGGAKFTTRCTSWDRWDGPSWRRDAHGMKCDCLPDSRQHVLQPLKDCAYPRLQWYSIRRVHHALRFINYR